MLKVKHLALIAVSTVALTGCSDGLYGSDSNSNDRNESDFVQLITDIFAVNDPLSSEPKSVDGLDVDDNIDEDDFATILRGQTSSSSF